MAKRFTLRNLLGLVILLLAGSLTLWIVLSFQGSVIEDIVEDLPENVDLSMKGIDYTETRDGMRRWNLQADSAAHSIEEGVTRIETIRMVFFDEKLGDVMLTASRGEMFSDSRRVELHGDVVVKSPKGYSLYTDNLRYSEVDRTVSTEDKVRMVSSGMEIIGRGMKLDVQGRTLVLLSSVRARIEGAVIGKKKG